MRFDWDKEAKRYIVTLDNGEVHKFRRMKDVIEFLRERKL